MILSELIVDMPSIEIREVSKQFKEIQALRDVSLRIQEGEIVGLLGPNGAGKSTLTKMLVGLLLPDKGKLYVLGKDVQKELDKVKQVIGYIHGETAPRSFYWRLSARHNLEMFGRMMGVPKKILRSRIDQLADYLNVSDALERQVYQLSSGMKAKLAVIRSLLHSPQILVADEPFIGLDPVTRKAVKDLFFQFAELGGSILLTSHSFGEIEDMCSRLVLLDKGKVIGDMSPLELKKAYSSQREIKVVVEGKVTETQVLSWLNPQMELLKIRASDDETRMVFSSSLYSEEQLFQEIFQIFRTHKYPIIKLEVALPSLKQAFARWVDERHQ